MNLKKINLVLLCLLIQGLYAQTDSIYPELPKSAKETSTIIPTGWKILSQATGDLNGDGYEDLAFALQSPLKKTIEYNDGYESDTLQTNPRILGIYLGHRNGKFKKALQSNTYIINRYTPTMDEPFKGLKILPNGDLQLDFYLWTCRECTSWSSHEYRFKYQNKAFELIGYEENITQRMSGDEISYRIDFKKGTLKVMIMTNDEEANEQESEEQIKKFELPRLPSIKSLGKPFEWKFQELSI